MTSTYWFVRPIVAILLHHSPTLVENWGEERQSTAN